MTDPNLSMKNGSLLRRIAEPGFTKDHLPPLDGVVVSHAHLDHMDMPTLLSLKGASHLLLAPGGLNYVKKVRRNGTYG